MTKSDTYHTKQSKTPVHYSTHVQLIEKRMYGVNVVAMDYCNEDEDETGSGLLHFGSCENVSSQATTAPVLNVSMEDTLWAFALRQQKHYKQLT